MSVGMARASAPIAALHQRDLSSRRRKIVDACSVDRHSVGPDACHSLDRQSISLARDVSLYLPSAIGHFADALISSESYVAVSIQTESFTVPSNSTATRVVGSGYIPPANQDVP